MRLYYYRNAVPNFGDDLNLWLWPQLIPELLDPGDGHLFVGIGTILNNRIPELPQKVVFGAGVGYGHLPVLDDRWTIFCVRGPLTAAALELPAEMAITDPAILVSALGLRPAPGVQHQISFIPHFETSIRADLNGIDLAAVCADAGVAFIDPSGEVDDVVAAIRGSEVVIAEAMHGAIIADAFRVPWIPVRCYNHILDFKWRDWCGSLELQYQPTALAAEEFDASKWANFLKSGVNGAYRVLSSAAVAQRATERMLERLERLRQTYGNPHQPVMGRLSAIAGGRDRLSGTGLAESDDPSVPGAGGADVRLWWQRIYDAGRTIDSIATSEDIIIFVDGAEWASQLSPGRRLVPFLERDGRYWGPPSDSDTAIREVERLLDGGARFMIFAEPAFWWLDHYSVLAEYLRSSHRVVLQNDTLIAFALSPRTERADSSGPRTESVPEQSETRPEGAAIN